MAAQRKRRDSASPPVRRLRSMSRRSRKGGGLARAVGAVEGLLLDVKRLILALGAMAGAIAAVIALFAGKGQVATSVQALPPLSEVKTYPNMPLGEYERFRLEHEGGSLHAERRSASASVGYRLAAYESASGASDEGAGSSTEEKGQTSTTDTTTTSMAEEMPGNEPGVLGNDQDGKPRAPGVAGKTQDTNTSRRRRGTGGKANPAVGNVVQGIGVPPVKTKAVVKALDGLRVSVPVPQPSVGAGAPAEGAKGGAAPDEGTSAPEKSGAEGAVGLETGDGLAGEVSAVPRQEVEIALPDKCKSTCGASPLLERASVYNRGSAGAARAVAAMFAETRGRVSQGKLYPIGTAVKCWVRLDEFAGSTVTLSWSVLSRVDNRRLPQRWSQRVTVKSFRRPFGATAAPIWFWVPMPLKHAGYVILLELGDGQRLAEVESDVLK
jgi:hypothetical protein